MARTEPTTRTATPGATAALVAIAIAELLAISLWFSATAVAPQLAQVWDLTGGESAWLTLSVQLGFVAGALGLAALGIPDRFNSRHIFLVAGSIGAAVNAALVLVPSGGYPTAVTLRFLTGVALAGVYPSGMKVMAGWFTRGRGMALGVLVGALTVGSAAPHLVRGLGFDWQGVVIGSSVLALVGVGVMAGAVRDGPHETTPTRFSFGHVRDIARNRGVRLSTYGYLGHMWELYGMWTWTAVYLAASASAGGHSDGWVPAATFAIIAIGGAGAWAAGEFADRRGRTLAAGAAMAVSGTMALLSPLVFGLHPAVTVTLFGVWGLTVVADSAQFSAMVTETARPEHRGTALTLQTALGFLLTLVTIRGLPAVADVWSWRWAFPVLAIGPALGIAAMARLRVSPAAAQIAGGRG